MNKCFKWLLITVICYILGLIIGNFLWLSYINSDEYKEYKDKKLKEQEYRNLIEEMEMNK